jgi:hypothetical protein
MYYRYVHAVKAAAAGGVKADASNGNSTAAAASATAAAADGVIQLPESGVTDEEVLAAILTTVSIIVTGRVDSSSTMRRGFC